MGGRVLLKEHVVPHIFDCQEDRKRAATAPVRSAVVKRRRLLLVEEALKSHDKNEESEPCTSSCSETVCVSTVVENYNEIVIEPEPQKVPSTETNAYLPEIEKKAPVEIQHVDVGVQVRPSYRSKYVSANISKSKISRATSPIKQNITDTSTSPFKIPSNRYNPPKIKKRIFEVESSSPSESEDEQQSNYSEFSVESDSDSDRSASGVESSVQTTISYISKNPKRYVGVTDAWFKHLVDFLHQKSGILSEHILLTLMKIKLNDSFSRLGDQFDLSEGHACKIFNKSILVIAHLLTKLIYWPDKARIIELLPIPFRARYHNVQSIIDCLEIQIEKPIDPFKQSLTWSEYKKCNTLKYMISSTPDGFINFISCGYGGRTSDTELFQQSGYLQKLPPGCSVMADRGFQHIQKLVEDKNCILVKPPSVYSSVKPSKAEVMETKRIASLRIHIERVIRRLREYEYLKPHSVIHHSLIGKTDHVITIACALTNLQNSVIKQM